MYLTCQWPKQNRVESAHNTQIPLFKLKRIRFPTRLWKKYIKISPLTHILFRSILFNFCIFWDFSVILLLLTTSLNNSTSPRALFYFYCYKLLRYVLWPRMWSILVVFPMSLRKTCYQLVLDDIVYMSPLYPVD